MPITNLTNITESAARMVPMLNLAGVTVLDGGTGANWTYTVSAPDAFILSGTCDSLYSALHKTAAAMRVLRDEWNVEPTGLITNPEA